ncbi:MAG: zf-HC2 domain-containing protein [Bacteroidetes bacterium]|jgi:predicted anti-sigma-YlaC factor YlaD|nr:zf-HC2 domain-containing protein [Bacteroidota bacterium]
MTCETSRELLSALFDSELGHDDQSELFAHLGHCPACRDAFGELLALRSTFCSTEQLTAPASLERRVMTQLRRQESASILVTLRQWLMARFTVPAPVAVAAVLLLILGTLLLRPAARNGNGYVYVPVLPEVEVVSSPVINTPTHP